jgi:hypothetical protein
MNAKHQFKYIYNEECEDFSPLDVTFDIPGEVTITQILWNFQCYLKACGFVFDGHLEIVNDETDDVIDEDAHGCCMGDSDNITDCYGKEYTPFQEVQKNKWVHGMCNPPSSDHVKASSLPGWGKHDKNLDPTDNCWNS